MRKFVMMAATVLLLAGCGPVDSAFVQVENALGLTDSTGHTHRTHYNLPYGTDPAQVFDAYMPGGHNTPRPLIVAIHPGAWQGDDKAWVDHFAEEYNAAGFAVFSINYRLAPAHRWPAQIDDVRASIRFFRALGNRIGIDPNRVSVLGDSAGGHLALMAGLQDDPLAAKPEWARPRATIDGSGESDLTLDKGFPGDVLGVMKILFGFTPTREQLLAASPITYVRRDASVLIVHGELDSDMAIEESDELNSYLLGAGADVLYLRRHSSQHIDFKDDRVNRAVIDWLSARL